MSDITPQPLPPPIITVRDLEAAYGERVIFRDLSFDIRAGEVFVIAGGSGCGKSTLMKLLIGLRQPSAGEIRIEGDNLLAAGPWLRLQILRKIGVAYQGGALFGNMTVLENVRLPLEEYTSLSDDQINVIALTKLRMVQMEHAAQKLPSELSGGMQKRAAIARAIALDPRIVFLDEPSAGLDPITSADLDQLILSLNRTLHSTFVVVTHELPSIFTIADRVLVLSAKDRTMIALDAPAALRDHSPDPFVRQFFNRQPNQDFITSAPTSTRG